MLAELLDLFLIGWPSAENEPSDAAFLVGSGADHRFVRIHGWDLILDGRSEGNKRALVDANNKLVINWANDYANGVETPGKLWVKDNLRLSGQLRDGTNRNIGLTYSQKQDLTDSGVSNLHKHIIGRFGWSGGTGTGIGVISGYPALLTRYS